MHLIFESCICINEAHFFKTSFFIEWCYCIRKCSYCARLLFEHTTGLSKNMMLFHGYRGFVCFFTVKVDAAQLLHGSLYGEVAILLLHIFVGIF